MSAVCPQSKFIQEDIDFLKSLNETPVQESNIYFTAKNSGYMRNLDHGILQHLENTYKRTINPNFVLCFHCTYEVMAMVLELYAEFEKDQALASDVSYDTDNGPEDQLDPEITGNLLHILTQADINEHGLLEPINTAGDSVTYPAGESWVDVVTKWKEDVDHSKDQSDNNGTALGDTHLEGNAAGSEIPPVDLGETEDGQPITETVTMPPAISHVAAISLI